MMILKYTKNCLLIILFVFAKTLVQGQTNIGMATGNYAGISGMWMNPASIVDSRYKFDINVIGLSSYYNNNYLLVKNAAIARRLFYRTPYNSSFASVKKDLLEETTVNGRVFARTENNIQLPLSFLITTGKKSAIAFNMTNKTVNAISGLNAETAKMFYDELNNPSLFNKPMNNDSLRQNFLNWQEIGFTYGRVLIGKGNIFLKAAVTGKWLGAGAGGFIQTDNATVTFNNATTMSLTSPLIKYGRTQTADIDDFSRRNLFNNLEDQVWGMDAGIVFEWRANIKKFKYTTEDEKELLRRDRNKYLLRLGIAVVDIGEFTLNRKLLTNDHSASFSNWNFTNLRASNFSDFDTAYAQRINYISGAPSTFTYRLPGSAVVNADLHLLGGFYVNIAARRPLSGYGEKATTYIPTESWTVITPRFETKFLGIYVPITRMRNQTAVGATVKFGPFYAGSNNLAQILNNPKSMQADFHAGFRLSILHGKPSKILKSFERIARDEGPIAKASQKRIDSLSNQIEVLKTLFSEKQYQKPVTIILNNADGTSEVVTEKNDSIFILNKSNATAKPQEQKAKVRELKTTTQTVSAADTTTNYLIRQLAQKELELKKIKEEQDQQKKSKKNEKKSNSNNANEELNIEMEKIQKQLAIQNAALITTTAVAAGNKNGQPISKTDSLNEVAPKDSLTTDVQISETQLRAGIDTIVLRDTIYITKTEQGTSAELIKEANIPEFESIYYATGKTTLQYGDVSRIKRIAAFLKKNPGLSVLITGCTDATGSAAANNRVSLERANAVQEILYNEGIDSARVKIKTEQISGNGVPSAEARRTNIILQR